MKEEFILYKYFALPSNGKEVDFLKNHFTTLKFSRPSSLNDPFDCKVLFHLDGLTQKEWRVYLRADLKAKYPNLSVDEITEKLDEVMLETPCNSQKWVKEQEEIVSRFVEAQSEEMAVACLSEVNDDILMWSHYANSHKGVCIGLDSKIMDENMYSHLKKVDYKEDYPSFRQFLTRELKETRDAVFFRKSEHWKYEKEWRFLCEPTTDEGAIFVPIPSEALKCIIFGCSTSEKDIERVRDAIENNCQYYIAEKSSKQFKVEIKPYKN